MLERFDYNDQAIYSFATKEIEGILKTEIMSDKTRELLTEYKDNLK